MIRAYLGLGSNLGNRREVLEQAISLLSHRPGIQLLRISSLYETEPVDVAGGWFFNCVAEVDTSLTPQHVLETLFWVEEACGRSGTREPGEARIADIDLLLYGSQVISEPNLEVPHPRMHVRRFVLEPLGELEPDLVHPGLGISVGDLLKRLPPTAEVRVVARDWVSVPVRERGTP
ncbi:MAG: 2-amino-4-hydroxy-6-hydroxymethyldihydropteridine diphosphokinase [Candidatus Methylomirabilales bacterium]